MAKGLYDKGSTPQVLEDNWETIRDEALSMLKHNAEKFRVEEEGITEVGDWRYLIFYKNGEGDNVFIYFVHLLSGNTVHFCF